MNMKPGESEQPKTMSRKKLTKHIRNIHSDFDKDQLVRFIESGRQPVTSFNASDCPFCNEWSDLLKEKLKKTSEVGEIVVTTKRFRRHVAMHLKQLAIWAVPQHHNDEEEDGDGDGSVDSHSQHGSQGSGEGPADNEVEDKVRGGEPEDKKEEEAAKDMELAEETEWRSKEKKMEEWQKHLEATAKLKAEIEELEMVGKEQEEARKKKQAEEDRLRDMLWYV